MADIVSATNGLTEKHLSSHPLWRRRMSFGRSSFRTVRKKNRESKFVNPQEIFQNQEQPTGHSMNGKAEAVPPVPQVPIENDIKTEFEVIVVEVEPPAKVGPIVEPQTTQSIEETTETTETTEETIEDLIEAVQDVISIPEKPIEHIPGKGILINKFLAAVRGLEKSDSMSSMSSVSSANSSYSSFASISASGMLLKTMSSSSIGSISFDFFTTLPRSRSLDSMEKPDEEANMRELTASENSSFVVIRKFNSLSSIEDLLNRQ